MHRHSNVPMGVAMGMKGTEAGEQASDMVLADDNFGHHRLRSARRPVVYDNLKKFILFMLPTNEEALVIIAAILFEFLPLTPAQVLWINIVSASTWGLALALSRRNVL
ncbi:MAG: hypothetical protein P0107_01070 [Nitrosomonas sp.]|nr:hypothetical protein [Nitrosomonas sp.]